MIEALLVSAFGPAAKLQHLRLSQGLESKKLNLGSDFGPSDLGVKVKHNSMICNDFPTAFWIGMCVDDALQTLGSYMATCLHGHMY